MANSEPSMRAARRTRLIGLVVAMGGVMPTLVAAQTHHYVLPNGKRIPLTRSQTEFGVLLRPGSSVGEAGRRVQASVGGTLTDIPAMPQEPMKLVQVASLSPSVRTALEADPAVDEVCYVFRVAGLPVPVFSTGRLVVQVAAGVSHGQRQAIWAEYGLIEVEAMRHLPDVYILRPRDVDADEVAIAERLAADGRMRWATPDLRRARVAEQVAPADPFFKFQWHLENTGQELLFGVQGTTGADIEARGAWEIADGSGVLFGMLDTGVDVDHADLRGNYIGIGQDVTFPAGSAEAGDPRPSADCTANAARCDRHGTSVAGLMVAAANEIGVRGVSFNSKFTASRGIGTLAVDTQLASAFTFAMEQNVDVHNNSWGPAFPNILDEAPVIITAIQQAFAQGRDLDGPGGNDPLGMVIVFAAGNEGAQLLPQSDLTASATLSEVIAVGATGPTDLLTSFSNFGVDVDFVAPGDSIATVDNEDGPDRPMKGFNVGGFTSGGSDIDPDGSYTGTFNGTSAASPIAAGVAGLILSVNEQLTATDVRIVMEHTCDKVSQIDARYNAISEKSLLYGHGRINARRAAEAARDSLTNDNQTWPDIAQNVRAIGTTLFWTPGFNTTEFLVVERVADFGFMPEDGECYDVRQAGCENGALAALPNNVNVLFVGCASGCQDGAIQSVDFELSAGGRKFFAIYARNVIGRYSFGSPIDFEGKTTGGTGTLPLAPPRPTIGVNPFPPNGDAPFTVTFNGNAVSDQALDNNKTTWDFGDGNPEVEGKASVSHIYKTPGAFTARLTMFDVAGVDGTAEIRINVADPNPPDVGGASPAGDIRIVVGLPGTPGASATEGISPFKVELQLEADTPANVQSISWDLGDGSPRVPGAAVLHTYVNQGDSSLVFLVTSTVTSTSSGGTTVTTTAQEFITVLPGQADSNNELPPLPGTGTSGGSGSGANPCGAVGMVPLVFMFFSLAWLRRRGV